MQIPALNLAVITVGLLETLLFLAAAVVSVREHELRAAAILAAVAVFLAAMHGTVGLLAFRGTPVPSIALLALPVLATAVMVLPFGRRGLAKLAPATPVGRIDERDIMFARARLEPGSERSEQYYRENPDKRAHDDRFRAKPGLLAQRAAFHNPHQFAAAGASFTTVSAFHAVLDETPAPDRVSVDPALTTSFIKLWAKKLGAVSVGVTELKRYHLYSHLGRNEPWGEAVTTSHTHAVALTVEMDHKMLKQAPYGPTIMESAQQYQAAGAIAVQIAGYLHNLGYEARAHIDGNYRVVCPLVARDAGLGEIGRLGLLMTPGLGPRVRIAVVTTDLPLVPDEPTRDPSVIDFCVKCRKCASTCPAKAVPFGDREEIDGVLRWQINQEACYTLWCAFGTDCGRCISVCPYSHPDSFVHGIIRFGVRRSSLFRSIAVKMDDLLYGRQPRTRATSQWLTPG